MKKISILINKEKLEISSNPYALTEYIYNYVNYKLSPYKMLGLFAYNTYPTDQYLIDGTTNPQMLIEHIRKASNIASPTANSIIPYVKNSNFFNSESGQFNLTTHEYLKIATYPENYCIIFSNIYS